MARPDGVAAHFLHHLDLADERRLVDGRAEWPQVVVKAHALELPAHAVEHETALTIDRHRADSEARRVAVDGLSTAVGLPYRQREPVEAGRLGTPGARPGDGHQPAFGRLSRRSLERGHHAALRVGHAALHAPALHRPHGLPINLDLGRGGRQTGRAHEDRPVVEPRVGRRDELHGAVEARSGIPAAALLAVVQADADHVLSAPAVEKGRDVHPEGVVAVGPPARLAAVDIDHRLAHGAVEAQFGVAAVGGNVDGGAVEAASYPGQRARTAALLGGLLLAVLRDGHALQVPLPVERPADGPVVGHLHGLPAHAVAAERPVAQVAFGSVLRLQRRGGAGES